MSSRLDDRHALVTGAGRGIGLAIVRELAARGAHVFAGDLPDVLADWPGVERVEPIELDITDPGARTAVMEHLRGGAERLDILVNNAGMHLDKGFEEVTAADWQKIMSVNVESMYFLIQQLVPLLQQAREPAIVNLASTSSWVAYPGHSVYEISKAAVAMLTRSLALELAPDVRVNAVAPGLIDTDMSRTLFSSDEDMRRRAEARAPIKRAGRPEDIARAVAFLASSDASYVVGHVLLVDGGWMLR